eukprot:GHVU01206213.1.p1 GENE.GHVU01206213.1~~GHVU01206213.1.p1  ORF type:complete len:264 (+),score=47.67 GHVU01206213.1:1077-1868(+)
MAFAHSRVFLLSIIVHFCIITDVVTGLRWGPPSPWRRPSPPHASGDDSAMRTHTSVPWRGRESSMWSSGRRRGGGEEGGGRRGGGQVPLVFGSSRLLGGLRAPAPASAHAVEAAAKVGGAAGEGGERNQQGCYHGGVLVAVLDSRQCRYFARTDEEPLHFVEELRTPFQPHWFRSGSGTGGGPGAAAHCGVKAHNLKAEAVSEDRRMFVNFFLQNLHSKLIGQDSPYRHFQLIVFASPKTMGVLRKLLKLHPPPPTASRRYAV